MTVRQRYVDMISNSEVAYVFRKRAKVAKPRCKINVLKSVLVIFDKEVKHKQDVRNQLVFEGKSIPEEEILTKAITLAKEWTSCQEKIPPPSCKTPSCTQPAPNCSVLNTDAAWKASNLTAGLGWTIKTQEETAEFTNHVVLLTVLIAEGLALREALARCRELGLRRIRCESDSRESHPELYGILSDVFSFSSSFDFISLSWIPRGMNKAADKFAKQCLVEEEAFMADT